ncbi:DUF5804 family protein [Halovivax sp.]|uniref:DUF5804 family protein n=1 Tax=Halovivax sp. TaxID=1935978 RepID=UPI0025C3BE54|nr:DUF5804 family protein [Halovivax sp.]
MTRVCLVGDDDVTLQYELLSRETSREALSTYELERPFENSLAVRTVSLGAAVSLCNDLQWYIVRFVDDVLVQEPSVSEDEWLSRNLAEALRNGDLEPSDTGEFLKIYGVEYPSDRPDDASDPKSPPLKSTAGGDGAPSSENRNRRRAADNDDGNGADGEDGNGANADDGFERAGKLVEPLYARRADGTVPEYDLRPVSETVLVRLTETEYAP